MKGLVAFQFIINFNGGAVMCFKGHYRFQSLATPLAIHPTLIKLQEPNKDNFC